MRVKLGFVGKVPGLVLVEYQKVPDLVLVEDREREGGRRQLVKERRALGKVRERRGLE
jgi:hypothetical protein